MVFFASPVGPEVAARPGARESAAGGGGVGGGGAAADGRGAAASSIALSTLRSAVVKPVGRTVTGYFQRYERPWKSTGRSDSRMYAPGSSLISARPSKPTTRRVASPVPSA